MFERILVPPDGSKMGESTLPYVEELVSKLSLGLKEEFTLLQVLSSLTCCVVAGEASARVPYTERELEQIKNKAMDYLEKIGEKLKTKGAIVRYRVEVGHTAKEINKVADEINTDLVAMSTYGRSVSGDGPSVVLPTVCYGADTYPYSW